MRDRRRRSKYEWIDVRTDGNAITRNDIQLARMTRASSRAYRMILNCKIARKCKDWTATPAAIEYLAPFYQCQTP